MGRCLECRERQESGPWALAHFCRLSHLEARLISAQYRPVTQLFSCVPGSAFHFPSQCPKLSAPTQGSMLNISGSRPKFYSLLQTPHTHTITSLLSSFQVPLWSARPEEKFPCIQVKALIQTHCPPSWPVWPTIRPSVPTWLQC